MAERSIEEWSVTVPSPVTGSGSFEQEAIISNSITANKDIFFISAYN
jgi:hypothetical protein